jgi:hypothetical protein
MHGGTTPSVDWKALVQSPALFPFQLQNVTSEVMTRSGRIEVVRHSLGDELLVMRKNGHEHSAANR